MAAAESAMLTGWTAWTVFGPPADHGARDVDLPAVQRSVDEVTAFEVQVRGVYDVSGFRAGAELMFWLHGADPMKLQEALRHLRCSDGMRLRPEVWSAIGVHRDAEFNRRHAPGFLRGERPRRWLTVYPFTRDYGWYVLPSAERGRMLAEHGRVGSSFQSVVANTVSAFALGDHEWILPLESDELIDLVDMMRALRATEARLHVREETPFFTGRRIALEPTPTEAA